MSVSYYAHLVIGFAIDQKQLLLQPAVRGCSHRESYSRFCGQCGAPTWAQEEKRQELLFHNRQFSVSEPNTTDFQSGNGGLPVLVGVEVKDNLPLEANALEALEAIEQELREELKRLNVTPKGPFGIHVYRYVSY